jgi:hypothetical protein
MSVPDCFRDISEIQKRAKDLREWLQQNAPASLTEQKHLDEGTRERVYWHYGYMVALRDVLRFLTESPSRRSYKPDTTSSHSST